MQKTFFQEISLLEFILEILMNAHKCICENIDATAFFEKVKDWNQSE